MTMDDIVAMHRDRKALAAFAESAMETYRRLQSELESAHTGEIVAIHPESGEHFLGATLGKANDAAYQKHPDQWIYFVRIGTPNAAIALRTW
jgi:hypothetical protein